MVYEAILAGFIMRDAGEAPVLHRGQDLLPARVTRVDQPSRGLVVQLRERLRRDFHGWSYPRGSVRWQRGFRGLHHPTNRTTTALTFPPQHEVALFRGAGVIDN